MEYLSTNEEKVLNGDLYSFLYCDTFFMRAILQELSVKYEMK